MSRHRGRTSFAAERHRNAGDYEAYVAELAEADQRRPDHPGTLYNLACAEALAGRPDDAVAHLRRALELKPEWSGEAAKDEDFGGAARTARLAALAFTTA